MKVSREGKSLIVSREGSRSKPYRDQKGIWTIGVGAIYDVNGKPVTRSTPAITHEQAIKLFERQLPVYAKTVNDCLAGRDIPQNSFDAFVSLCFNIGRSGFYTSTALRRFKEGDLQGCAEAITWFNKITIKAGRVFPKGTIAHGDTQVTTQDGILVLVNDGQYLSGYVAKQKTKCISEGLVNRREAESDQFLSGYMNMGPDVENLPPREPAVVESVINVAGDRYPANPLEGRYAIRYEDLQAMTVEQLTALVDQPVAMMAACGYKRQVSAISGSLFAVEYPDIDDTDPNLPEPSGYSLYVTLDEDYPALTGTEIHKRVNVSDHSLLGRVQAQYRLGEAVMKLITTAIIGVGGSLA